MPFFFQLFTKQILFVSLEKLTLLYLYSACMFVDIYMRVTIKSRSGMRLGRAEKSIVAGATKFENWPNTRQMFVRAAKVRVEIMYRKVSPAVQRIRPDIFFHTRL